MKAWLTRMVNQQAQLDGKIRWSVQFIVRSATAIILCMLMIGLFGYHMVMSDSLEGFMTNRSKDEMHHIVDAIGTAIEGLVPADAVIGPEMAPEVQKQIKHMIRNIKYDYPNGYCILLHDDGTVLAQGIEPENAGVNRLDAQDYKGNFHIRQLRDTARQGGGFVEYVWKKLDGGLPFKKIAYARPLKGGQWWIASGVYLDSIGTVTSMYIDEQGWYLAGFTIGLLALMATLFFVVLQFGSVLGQEIAQPVVVRMKHSAQMADNERGFLAMELHNLVGRVAALLTIKFSDMAQRSDATTCQVFEQGVWEVYNHLDEASRDLRRKLFPLEVQQDGIGALRQLVKKETKGLATLKVDLVMGESVPRSDYGRERALYLIAQGLLQNVLIHAQATHVHITLRFQKENVMLTVKDNGRGFDKDAVLQRESSAQTRYGIPWMLAQVEVYGGPPPTIDPTLGQGTTVQVTMPWPPESESEQSS